MAVFTGSPTATLAYRSYAEGTAVAKQVVPSGIQRARWPTYTHAAGSGTGEINLIVLPAGRIEIYPDYSRLITSQFGAAATISLGYRTYTQPDGTVVAESAAAFTSAAAAGAGALDQAWVLPAVGYQVFNTLSGLIVFATIASGNIDDTDTIDGWADFTHHNG